MTLRLGHRAWGRVNCLWFASCSCMVGIHHFQEQRAHCLILPRGNWSVLIFPFVPPAESHQLTPGSDSLVLPCLRGPGVLSSSLYLAHTAVRALTLTAHVVCSGHCPEHFTHSGLTSSLGQIPTERLNNLPKVTQRSAAQPE